MLAGNKSDLNADRKITYEDGKALVSEWKTNGSYASFVETSALTGEVI